MDKERMDYIVKNQANWKKEFRKRKEDDLGIRRTLNEWYIEKKGHDRKWINKRLKKYLNVEENEFKEELTRRGFAEYLYLF